jgi:hypothetical protein
MGQPQINAREDRLFRLFKEEGAECARLIICAVQRESAAKNVAAPVVRGPLRLDRTCRLPRFGIPEAARSATISRPVLPAPLCRARSWRAGLVGTKSNCDAMGARVRVVAGGVAQIREIAGGAEVISPRGRFKCAVALL